MFQWFVRAMLILQTVRKFPNKTFTLIHDGGFEPTGQLLRLYLILMKCLFSSLRILVIRRV